MASDDSFQDVWKAAVLEYEAQTDRKLDKDATFRKFKTLPDLEDYVRQREESFTSFRGEHGKLFSRMSKCFKPLVPILNVLKGGIDSSPYAPAAIAFGAASYLLQACEKVTKYYDAVEELFGEIGNVTVRLKEYEHGTMEESLKSKMTHILAFILEIMGKTEKIVNRGRFKQWTRSLVNEDEITPSLTKLQRFAEEELGLVVALTYTRVGDLQNTAADTIEGVKEVKKAAKEILMNQQSERLRSFNEADEKRLAEALKTSTASQIAAKFRQNMEALTKGTGVWIKDDPMFQAWEAEKAPVLWVFGRPGVGKTMLATRTIEVLKTRFPQHPDIPSLTSVSYAYFKDDNPELNDCTKMWKAIADQMVKANDRFKKHVLSLLDKDDDVFASSRRAWELLFLDFFTEEKSTQGQTSLAYIVVDGLDEAPEGERIKFLACLSELTKRVTTKTRCRIQVAIFARPDVRADPGFDKIGSYQSGRIVITPDRNSKDIGAFIKQHLKELNVVQQLRRKAPKEFESLAKHIYSTVQARAQGMFLWARLVFDQLRKLPSPEAIKASLAEAPNGLDDMLHHVFKRFDTEEAMRQSYLRDLLTWVLCTYRPLLVSELFVLLHLTAGQDCVTIKQDLQSRYSSIFDVTGPSGEDVEEDDGKEPDDLAEVMSEADDDFDFLDESDDEGVESLDSESHTSGGDQAGTAASLAEETATPSAAANLISDSWRTTTVTFTHARIRDYLTTECDPQTRRWHDCSLFMHDLNETKQRMVEACIRILRTDIATTYEVENLMWYARTNWVKHLSDTNYGDIGSPLAINLARAVAEILNDGKSFTRSSYGIIDFFTSVWFETDKYISVVRKLISDHVEHLDECHRPWGERVRTSSRALFEALVLECATTWLTKTGFDDEAYLDKSEHESWLLYAFNSLSDDGVDEDNAPVFYYGNTIPLDDIDSIAKLVPLPQNEHWYTGVAWIMMEANEPAYTKKAIQYFNKARAMADGAWVALEGLAICHGDMELYQEAVNFMHEAISQLPQTEDYEGVDFFLRANMGTWQRQLGDQEESLRVTRQAYLGSLDFDYPTGTVSDHRTLLAIKNHIAAMYDAQTFDDIVHFLHDLDDRLTNEEGRSMWVVFLRAQIDDSYDVSIFDKLTAMTRSIGSQLTAPALRNSIERAVPLVTGTFAWSGNLWLIAECITWLYEVPSESEYAIELCQRVIELIDESDDETQQASWWHRDKVAAVLGMHYLKAAIAAKADGQDPAPTIERLDSLAYHQQGGKRYVRASYPALFMGQWLHDHSGAAKEAWIVYFKPSVKRALHLLGDNDPWNDQEAYAQLGRALLCANDIENARIAFGITLKPLELMNVTEDDSGDAEDAVAGVESPTEALSIRAHDQEAERDHDGTEEGNDLSNDNATGEEVADPQGEEPEEDLEEEDQGAQGQSTTETSDGEADGDDDNDDDDDDEQPDNFKYAGFYQMWNCDGCMETRDSDSNPYQELHFCRICADECFCESCIVLLQEGKLDGYTSCSSKHEHIQMHPVSQQAKDITTALMEKRFEPQQEWLDELWKVWGDGDGEAKTG